MENDNSPLVALAPVFLVFAALLFAAILWCMLSSCIGAPILRSISNLWEYAVLSSRSSGGLAPRRRREFGEQEIWEMESRGRAG
ncbi:hypothetical protein Hypma_016068 [Hypsizygus marmoreus]|uniref:Uncharacterized protein n=1 Tax=Hypsizygus marmoreus TaxID=39966 RepID=A0A369K9U8_HYPMA|nr:hypothetical protein Hypma_016068 [Hypsizygus marmoreus]